MAAQQPLFADAAGSGQLGHGPKPDLRDEVGVGGGRDHGDAGRADDVKA